MEEVMRTMSSPDRSLSPLPHNTLEKHAAPAIAEKLIQDHLAVVVSAVGGESGGGVEEPGRGGSNAPFSPKAEDGFGTVPQRLRQRALMRTAFALRVSTAVLCLASFSVMAADDTVGWAGDSFGRYREYRYLVAINAIAFLYSAFQISAKVHHAILKNKRKNILLSPTNYYFDLSMDQMLAYLLMSASSVSASCNDIWVSRFGSDKFRDMANGAITISFLAFLALALSAIISACNLFRWSSPGAS